jgi:hypothetical protein
MPSKTTLSKYGLSLSEWESILDRQGGVCPICGKVPSTGRWVVDHEHVKNWKNLPPEVRKSYVRGILCWYDNRNILTRGTTIEKLKNAVKYLEEYEKNKLP